MSEINCPRERSQKPRYAPKPL